jgi:dihydropteroate synthase
LDRARLTRSGTGAGVSLRDSGPIVMGILNVTPDSFSDGGEFFDLQAAVSRAGRMLEEGVGIIDVGGESTRPGADPVPPEEELRRVAPVVRAIAEAHPGAVISVDTYRAATARAAIEAGASIVNDVTALRADPEMTAFVAEAGCPVVLMHMLGEPRTMQQHPRYDDVVREVRDFLAERAELAVAAGVDPANIVLDPGIGFGKTLEHNLALINRLNELVELGHPVLVGASRKSFLGRITDAEAAGERISGTVATTVMAYERGASIFRVHDVRPNREALAVAEAVRRA